MKDHIIIRTQTGYGGSSADLYWNHGRWIGNLNDARAYSRSSAERIARAQRAAGYSAYATSASCVHCGKIHGAYSGTAGYSCAQ